MKPVEWSDWPAQGIVGLHVEEAGLDMALLRLRQLAAARRQVSAWIPEHGGLISNLRVLENVLLPAGYLRGLSPEVAWAAVEALLQDVPVGEDIRPLFPGPVARLSRNQRLQIAVLRTALLQPALVVMELSAWRALEGMPPFWQALAHRQWEQGLLVLVAGHAECWPDYLAGRIKEKTIELAGK